MSDRRPYSRVYWSILDDPKFDTIRDRMDRLGAWTLLLVVADQAYPAPAYVPRSITVKTFRAIRDAGLVEDLGGGRFRVCGMAAERDRRSASASNASNARWNAGRNADGNAIRNAETMPSQAKPSQDETSIAEAARVADTDDPADAYWSLTGRYPTDKLIRWLDDLGEQYGQEPTTRALVRAHMADASTATLLGRTKDILAAEARALDRRERDEERERLRQKRAAPRELPAWQQEYRRMIGERYGEGAG